ncbi:MAG: Panacea domain-containing protein [Planctomycetota bacterium]
MRFRFDFDKALQAAAELLRHEPHRQMGRVRFMKLLYIADREALKETGRPITCDAVVAMEHGPVLSRLYDIIKGESLESPRFDEHIGQQGYLLFLKADPGKARLNRFEIRKLREVSERYRDCGDWEIAKETHGFEEWIKHNPGESSCPIPLEDVLAAVGYSPDRIEAILQDASCARRMHGLFRRG